MEVFPTLHLEGDCKVYMEDVRVDRVVTTRARDLLKVYISCDNIIEKEYIYKVEKELHKQLFSALEGGKEGPEVKLYETFHLSAQYDAPAVFGAYKNSMLLELKEYSPMLHSMLKSAEMSFEADDKVVLTMEDIPLYHQKSGELLQILDKIVCERCGVRAFFEVAYEEPKESKYREEDDIKIARRIAEIAGNRAAISQTSDSEYVDMSGVDGNEFEHAASPMQGADAKNTEQPQKQPVQKAEPAQPPKKEFKKEGKKDFKSFRRQGRRSDNPDVLYGYDVEGEIVPMDQILDEMGEITIRGKVLSVEEREIRNEKTIVSFFITDFTDTMKCKMFCPNEELPNIREGVKKGAFLLVRGLCAMDSFDKDLTISIKSLQKTKDFTVTRMDHSAKKRVELHCHTKMSDMDGVSDVIDIVKRAYKWGHPAIAITDHGVVQALADVFHTWQDLYKGAKAEAEKEGKQLDRQDFFKVICGCEIYLVDDLKNIVVNPKGQSLMDSFVVFDIETTGFSSVTNHIIEIGAVKVENGKIVDRFSTYVNPQEPIPYRITKLTTITDADVMDAPTIDQVLPEFFAFCEGCVLVAHNASFDTGFIKENARKLELPYAYTHVDTLAMARVLLPQLAKFTLDHVAKTVGVSLENHHRAVDDAEATAEIFEKFIPMLLEKGAHDLDAVNELGRTSTDYVRKTPSYHAIVLAKNDVGRVNLYKLISASHLQYFNRRPKVPKSLILENREGLILGSACEAGELYRALLRGAPQAEIADIVNFYDYLEVQPLGNNAFMLRDEKSSVNTWEDLQDLNRKVIELGEQWNKLVCATCDVHFLDPEDEVYRRIIMASKGFKDADDQAPLYLRTTEEMLGEFEYLGSDKAEEIVITNTRKIAAMCERISPVRPDKCPPVIPNSDDTLRTICYNHAHDMYGDKLPKVVVDRLERELHSIISNGFAVMYIIAQKLVWKSNEDGYLVGSRGSVGSSLAATMSGITEVNPLSPHYYCPNCHYYDFDSEDVKKFSGMAGCDMPDKICPKCGKPLKKDGFDIPFETFLGFKGDKEPDIDLNFSGEYQSRAHSYTEVIFGKGQTFRAGTIGTLADKTAYGFVAHYYEDKGIRKRRCEIERIVSGCVGVRRTTGQHPGGIIVLPLGEEIDTFTPVQHPADDMTTRTVTTHFDYHSIDHNLLKLDILGHDDPTMIRMLQDLTGLDPVKDIPLDSKEVMSLFQNTEALGVTPEDLGGCKLGALGIPEFGTDFAMQMLIDAKPKYFSDLVRISGLSHGTDVWLGNAKDLILSGQATIQTAICCRDDIMIYLIQKGLEEGLSFTIMESVRKGKGLKPEWIEEMKAHDVPQWYIDSCLKIKYMFPKAHAAAYVMMAWRVAYCKVFYPLAYYAAYFSIRASGFTYKLMCQGRDKLEYHLAEYKSRSDSLSKKEQDTLRDMRIVQEMYARGFEFMPIDIYRAKARNFQIIDGKLMPSLSSIDGLGEKAADAIVFAAEDGKFLSKEDFINRTKVTKTVCDLMAELGILTGLPESNQLSLFDMVM